MLFLERLLELDRLGQNAYQSRELYKMTGGQFVYGGCIVAQALSAMFRSFADAEPSSTVLCDSLHCYFLLPSVAELPIVYSVMRVRDGRALKNRRIEGRQSGELVFVLEANFVTSVAHESQAAQSFFQAIDPIAQHQLAPPETLPTFKSIYASQLTAVALLAGPKYEERRSWLAHHVEHLSPIEERPCFPAHLELATAHPVPSLPHYQADRDWFWWRPTGSDSELEMLGRKPASLYQCMMAFASDHVLFIALRPFDYHYGHSDVLSIKSLDHTIHFHAWPSLASLCPASLWALYESRVERVQHGRAYVSGRMYSRSGLCLATVTQEGLLKLKPKAEISSEKASKL